MEESSFTHDALQRVADTNPWPEGMEMCLLKPGCVSTQDFLGCLVVFEAALQCGFCLPLPGLYVCLLRAWNLSPVQFSPNSWRFLAA